MSIKQLTSQLGLTEKIQILSEYKELKENGSIGKSLLRTLSEQVCDSSFILLCMSEVAHAVAHDLADEYISTMNLEGLVD